jgi:hypothetical protein
MAKAKRDDSSETTADPTAAGETAAEAGTATTTPRKKRKKRKKRRGSNVNKGEMVRQALSELGQDAPNRKILDWFQNKGVDISASHISNIKKQLLGERGASRQRGDGARGRSAAAMLKLDEIRLLKELILRIGASEVHEVVDLFQAGSGRAGSARFGSAEGMGHVAPGVAAARRVVPAIVVRRRAAGAPAAAGRYRHRRRL